MGFPHLPWQTTICWWAVFVSSPIQPEAVLGPHRTKGYPPSPLFPSSSPSSSFFCLCLLFPVLCLSWANKWPLSRLTPRVRHLQTQTRINPSSQVNVWGASCSGSPHGCLCLSESRHAHVCSHICPLKSSGDELGLNPGHFLLFPFFSLFHSPFLSFFSLSFFKSCQRTMS